MPKPVDGHRQQFKAKEYDIEKPVDELFSDLKGLLQSWYSYGNNSMEKKYCRLLHFILVHVKNILLQLPKTLPDIY